MDKSFGDKLDLRPIFVRTEGLLRMRVYLQPRSSVSPTQDASHILFTHTLLFRDTARCSDCTCFVPICPLSELLS